MGGKAQITEAIRLRAQTDKLLSVAWVALPVIAVLALIVWSVLWFVLSGFTYDPETGAFDWGELGFWEWLAGSVGVFVVVGVLAAIVAYNLINRRNQHFKREALLRAGVLQYLRERAAAAGGEHMISSELATMQSVHSDANANDDEKSAVLWTILLFIPVVQFFAGLYVLYFLTKYAHEHDQRWQAFMQQAQSAGSKLGMTVVVPSWKALPRRSYVIYLVVTLFLTFYLFLIYWIYVLIKDPNEHFKAQWQFEDQFAAVAT